jgi:hypothetical protein
VGGNVGRRREHYIQYNERTTWHVSLQLLMINDEDSP